MTSDRRPYVGVAVIVRRQERVLLGKRRSGHGAGTWQFPGGHLEFNESIRACAAREVFEETGLQIRDVCLGPYTNDIFQAEEKHYVTLFAIATCPEGEAAVREPDKCEQWKWFSWSRLPTPLFLPILNLLSGGFPMPG